MKYQINKQTIFILIAVLAVGILIGFLISTSADQEIHTSDGHQHETDVAEETIWTCSMHPQIRQPEPGDCPICGMDLIPLEEDNGQGIDPMAISMSPTAMQLANVRTAEAGEMSPVKEIRLNGKVQEDERLVYSQSSHIPGRIEQLQVNFTGEFVRKGQVIAYIYSPELVTAQEELFEAQKIKESQPGLFKSAKEKLKNWKLSERQIENILERGQTQENFPITADVSGIVTEKMVNLGDYLKRGEPIYKIADLSRVWVLFDVYESDLAWVKEGDEVSFSVKSLPGKEYNGEISFLDPVINPKTRVAQARVVVSNQDNELKPEMFVSGVVEADLDNKEDVLVIPKSAVMWTGKRSVVYVKSTTDQGISFMMREVVLGPALGESYVIKEGLSKGEEIAVSGTFSIDAAAQLAGKPSMMSPEGGTSATGHNHGQMKMSGSMESIPSGQKAIELNDKAKAALQPVYSNYIEFKNDLVNDDFTNAKENALSLKKAINEVDMGLFSGESHDLWMKHYNPLVKSLEHIGHLNDIDEIRNVFMEVSNIMISMTKTFSPLEDTIYVLHCPMANSNKGADWLSWESEIRNPYYGEAMLKCGEVKTELK